VSKILIVDDDPDMVAAGRMVLEKEGYEVSSAPNVVEGLRAVEEYDPDLLILDVMMEEPDDGLRLARDLRRKGHTLPILMLTSVNQALGIHIGADPEIVPVDDFQEKPADPVTLVQKVKRLLEAREGASC
jgi:DNA-binding response OmpR family regulator